MATKETQKKKKVLLAPLMPLIFIVTIVLGALLLMLPVSAAEGHSTTFTEAMFTATTSVCVTGSIVVDTCTHWSTFGQLVILGLIQFGGLGVIAIVVFAFVIARNRLSLGNILMLQDMFNLDSSKEILKFVVRLFLSVMFIELLGAIAYMFILVPDFGPAKGIWYSIFNSISAFCNAGICIIDPNSLAPYHDNAAMLIITMLLIIIGGLGFVVWIDLKVMGRRHIGCPKEKKANLRYSMRLLREHTKLCLVLTGAFILAGAVLVLLLEGNNPGTLGNMSPGEKVLNSIFESVTYRTAGFTTFPQENMSQTTTTISALFMFIGGSPVGTAGGVKTVTIFVVFLNVYAYIRNKNEVVTFRRKISNETIMKANAVVIVQFTVVMFLCLILMYVSGTSLADSLFETNSAASTVGLSRNLTDKLNLGGQWIVMVGMLYGRIGPMSMMLLFQPRTVGEDGIHHADGELIIG